MTASATHGSFTIDRHFDAKPERVFKAFADGDAKKRWFAGPNGWEQTERACRSWDEAHLHRACHLHQRL